MTPTQLDSWNKYKDERRIASPYATFNIMDFMAGIKVASRKEKMLFQILHRIGQTLGEVLGYPRFSDDPKNFSDARRDDGSDIFVCKEVEDVAIEAAKLIQELRGKGWGE